MSNETEQHGEAQIHGLMISLDEARTVNVAQTKDGYYFKFENGSDSRSLRLSKEATAAMVELISQLESKRPRVFEVTIFKDSSGEYAIVQGE